MTMVEKTIDVNQPVTTVYNQWTQFEEFPQFMKGVEDVRQISDDRLHWKADIAGVEREWDAEITDQVPDRVIAWKAIGDVRNDGRIEFDPLGEGMTRVRAVFHYEPEGMAEKAADALNVIDNRVEGDLKRFKEFIEQRGRETGAWRGEIH